MSDEVIGISILQGERLYVCAYSPTFQGGFAHWSHIPVTPEKTPKLPSPSWQYKKEGNKLHVFPSLHILGGKECQQTEFHNLGNWTTDFIEVGPEIDAFAKLREINKDLVSSKKAKTFFNE